MKIKVALMLALSMAAAINSFSQEKVHNVVFHLSTPDTLAYRALTKQLDNVLKVWPKANIEVVIHNKGLGFVIKGKSHFEPEIDVLVNKGVKFVVCENSLQQQKLTKEQIFTQASFVPAGLVEIIEKQEAGWSYIKAGF
jgi:intracellular sulfur oxidation DsrE/DsrF family protein